MKFEVSYHTTYDAEGRRLGRLDDLTLIPEGIVREATPVRTEPPDQLEYAEQVDGEDLVEYVGTETWEYDIVDGLEQDFRDALKDCPQVIEYAELPEAA